ncbi:MAG: PQQ-binding-like beta-propeller repeat protein [Bacteroidales bacterium]|nr:PQQ-binding-like beta-propeller repeat protein [Bacteroidales bacterium]
MSQGDDSTISMPVESDGLLFFYTSFVTDREGDIGGTHIRWRMKAPILQLSTPVVVDGFLYTIDSRGVFYRLRASSGQVIWSENLKGKFHSSPLYADGHIYVSSTRGETLVYTTGAEPELVSKNKLEGEIWATPAMTDGAIIIRTSKFLYKIEER